MIRAALSGLLLTGCIAAPEAEGPCPCAAPLRCCTPIDRCLPVASACFTAADPTGTLTVEPAEIPHTGGVEITVALRPPAAITAVMIGPAPCEQVARDPFRCIAPAWPGDRAAVDLEVAFAGAGGTVRRLFVDALRYRLPDFVEWPGAPLGPANAAVILPGQVILAIQGAPPRAVALGPWLTPGDALPLPPLRDLHLEDLDRDGGLDLLAIPFEAPPLRAELDGSGAIAWWTAGALDATVHGILFDRDGDGFADLIGHTEARGALGPRRAPLAAAGGPRGLALEPDRDPLARLFEEGGTVHAYAVLDQDDDGDADLVICGDAQALAAFEEGAITEVFDTAPLPAPCSDIATLDLNPDGRQDLAWVPRLDYAATADAEALSGLWVIRNVGGFQLATPQASHAEADCVLNRAATSTLALGRSVVAAFDVDLDGDVDLFLPAPYSRCAGPLVWYESAGERFITRRVPGADANVQPTSVHPADLDGDGDLDVVVTAEAPDQSRIWRNLRVEQGDARALVVRPTCADGRTPRGARISLEVGGRLHRRILGNRNSGDLYQAHFGLGAAAPPYAGEVRWPDGTTVRFVAEAPGAIEVGCE